MLPRPGKAASLACFITCWINNVRLAHPWCGGVTQWPILSLAKDYFFLGCAFTLCAKACCSICYPWRCNKSFKQHDTPVCMQCGGDTISKQLPQLMLQFYISGTADRQRSHFVPTLAEFCKCSLHTCKLRSCTSTNHSLGL